MFDIFGMIREKGVEMISKELLSEVLKKEIREFVIEKNELRYILKDDINNIPELYFINIYELSHKCKEWALNKGYFIYSTNELSFIKTFSLETIETFSNGKDTEIECIIKACQWILDNKED